MPSRERAGLTTGARRVLAATAALLASLVAVHAEPPEAPVVFRSSDTLCYRGPSLQTVGNRLVAVVQARSGYEGARACSDNGWIDLVARASDDGGATWSADVTVVAASDIERLLVDPSSPVFDPAVATMAPVQRAIRVGAHSLVAADGHLVVMFAARFTTSAACGAGTACLNSEDAARDGSATERFFMVRSRDSGGTWSRPRPLDEVFRRACLERFMPPDLAARLLSGPVSPSAAWWEPAVAASLRPGRGKAEAEAAAASFGAEPGEIEPHLPLLRQLFASLIRVGPGNAVAFLHEGRTRIVFPTAPVVTWTDDYGATFHCADTRQVTRGSERQIAWLGGSTLVMSLRRIGAIERGNLSRLFSVSHDGGESWSRDAFVETDGLLLMPDAVAQATIVGLPDRDPPEAIHVNLANDGVVVHRGGKPSGPVDYRSNLAAVRLYLSGDSVVPATEDGCPATRPGDSAYRSVYPGSAAYSAAVLLPGGDALGILFEASDEFGAAHEYHAWYESLRFARLDLSSIGGSFPGSNIECSRR